MNTDIEYTTLQRGTTIQVGDEVLHTSGDGVRFEFLKIAEVDQSVGRKIDDEDAQAGRVWRRPLKRDRIGLWATQPYTVRRSRAADGDLVIENRMLHGKRGFGCFKLYISKEEIPELIAAMKEVTS